MRRAYLLIVLAWSLHLASWFLPVIKSIPLMSLPAIPGWSAFMWISCALRPCKDVFFEPPYGRLLVSVTVVTTLLFIFGSPLVAARSSRHVQLTSAWIAAIGFVVNAHWCLLPISEHPWSILGIGYFFWWASFAVLAAGLFDLSGQEQTMARRTALLSEITAVSRR
jgi:hypothetical protein